VAGPVCWLLSSSPPRIARGTLVLGIGIGRGKSVCRRRRSALGVFGTALPWLSTNSPAPRLSQSEPRGPPCGPSPTLTAAFGPFLPLLPVSPAWHFSCSWLFPHFPFPPSFIPRRQSIPGRGSRASSSSSPLQIAGGSHARRRSPISTVPRPVTLPPRKSWLVPTKTKEGQME
jgi:hypothetical protein